MSAIRMAAVAAPFDRDLGGDFERIAGLIDAARADGVQLLALPEACLGGYLADLNGRADGPPALRLDGPEIARLAALAGDMVVCAGYCEDAGPRKAELRQTGPLQPEQRHPGPPQAELGQEGDRRYNSVVCVHDGRVLGNHRKVHQPLRENASYASGDSFAAFDTPVGRIGLLICYDKAFPEAARSLALDGAEIIVVVSAWPGSRTDAPADLADDRWTRRFDLFDRARALENQVVWLSANQSGTFGSLRFVCSAKVVDPGGDVLATTGTAPGMAVATVDVTAALAAARRSMGHLRDRRPDAYRPLEPALT